MPKRILLLCFLACFYPGVSSATPGWKIMPDHPAPCGQGGVVQERADRVSQFRVFLTDCQGNQIGRFPFATVNGMSADVNVPGVFNGIQVGDAHNITKVIGKKKGSDALGITDNGGEQADLLLESLVINNGQIQFESIFGRMQKTVGFNFPLNIPDLYADTNGDGMLDDGDLLYSIVDIHQFLAAMPTFSIGDVFQIQNGEIDALPGMLFSTTPFVFDPSSSFGFDFTPFTGEGDVLTQHTPFTVVPEPSTMLLVGAGMLLAVRFARRGI